MKGKSIFSLAEAARVRELLRRVRAVERDEQKKLRACLRNEVGFYISDFTTSIAGFSEADFDFLVERGTIKIG